MSAVAHERHIRVESLVRTLLLVEQDPAKAELVAQGLGRFGIGVIVVPDGAEALMTIGALSPEAVLLSPQLELISAATFVRVLRRRHDLPVVVGVSDGDDVEAAACLSAGATSCVRWPFEIDTLLALLTTTPGSTKPVADTVWTAAAVMRAGAITVDEIAHEVRVGDRRVQLPLREFTLLALLVRYAGRAVPTDVIRDSVWGLGGARATNTLAVHIRRLRIRLGDDPHEPRIIRSVRGVGYRLDPGMPSSA